MTTNAGCSLLVITDQVTGTSVLHVLGHHTRDCFPENATVEIKDIPDIQSFAKAIIVILRKGQPDYVKPCEQCWSSVLQAVSLGKREAAIVQIKP